MRILCYGDSNTWGATGKWEENDIPSQRYEDRRTAILQRELREEHTVIEEGLGKAVADFICKEEEKI